MKSTSLTKVIWYNTIIHQYQSGSLRDFQQLTSNSTNPQEIQPLERFNDASDKILNKIVGELNKCRPHI